VEGRRAAEALPPHDATYISVTVSGISAGGRERQLEERVDFAEWMLAQLDDEHLHDALAVMPEILGQVDGGYPGAAGLHPGYPGRSYSRYLTRYSVPVSVLSQGTSILRSRRIEK
jgi:hypothetical protein